MKACFSIELIVKVYEGMYFYRINGAEITK